MAAPAVYHLTCTECGKRFESRRPDAKTDTGACRQRRSRRLAALRRKGAEAGRMPPEQRELTDIVNGSTQDVARPLLEEELKPVVREAITEDTLRAIRGMVALTPDAVAALAEDLRSENATIRQRAYKLVLQYTVGHPAVVRPEDADPHQQLIVNLHVPRPGSGETQADVDGEAQELRTCVVCDHSKPVEQFVANSDRCKDCHAKLQEKAMRFLEQQEPDSTQ